MITNDSVIENVHNFSDIKPDDIFITSVNYEERCLGIPLIFSKNIIFENSFLFVFDQEKQETQENITKIHEILKTKTKNYEEIISHEQDVFEAVARLCSKIMTPIKNSRIIVDITTMPIKLLLILLKTLDDLKLWNNIRIYYTEPLNYKTELYLPMSIGIGKIQAIGEFIANTSTSLPSLLIEFLGYEGDRARAIYNHSEPDDTVLIIPKPAFYPSWEGKTERMNNTLLKIVGKKNRVYANPIDVKDVINTLEEIKQRFPPYKYKWTVIPLGTKPQALGLYLFWKKNPNLFTILHAEPLKNNPSFSSTGIGKTRLLFEQTA